MNALHDILFNMNIMYSFFLGVWSAVMAANNRSISGNFWGAVAIYAGLAGVTLIVGIIMSLTGLRLESGRMTTYFLYMAWLVVIMPGLFSMLRGRDDRNAAIAFSLLAFFNFAVAISMFQRTLVTPWA